MTALNWTEKLRAMDPEQREQMATAAEKLVDDIHELWVFMRTLHGLPLPTIGKERADLILARCVAHAFDMLDDANGDGE